jgi:hypothetical protein
MFDVGRSMFDVHSSMKTTFAELLSDVASFEKKLATPKAFHLQYREAYHNTARSIARRILMPEMPLNHDPDRWRAKVETVIDRITAELILGEAGMILTIYPPKGGQGRVSPKQERPANEIVTHADVVEWIKAGETGVPGGKIITARDRKRMSDAGGGEKGYNAVATIVMRAYYSLKPQANYVRLRRAIQKYLHGSEDDATGDKLLDSVAAAWVEHFSVRFPRDMGHYVSGLCRKF